MIEDCAHSVGAKIQGRMSGSIGSIGVFSFHQQKNMVTLGEGGLVVTSNALLRERMVGFRSLNARSYDPKGKYLALDSEKCPMENRFWLMDFGDFGSNYRMTDMQAAVGRVQLRKLPSLNLRRREIALRLHRELSPIDSLGLPDLIANQEEHSWHVFHVLVRESFPFSKEEFMWKMLNDFGIKGIFFVVVFVVLHSRLKKKKSGTITLRCILQRASDRAASAVLGIVLWLNDSLSNLCLCLFIPD